MPRINGLLPLYLVYSSHKSGTQSVVRTLTASGFPASHFHCLEDASLLPEDFVGYLKFAKDHYGKKPTIISSFRLPVDRHISSFFQWYGIGCLKHIPSYRSSDSVIALSGLGALNSLFVSNLASRRFVGYKDSIHEIFRVLHLDPRSFSRQQSEGGGFFHLEHPDVNIFLIRYEYLFRVFPLSLERMLGEPFRGGIIANRASDKWYSVKYVQFRSSLRIPAEVIQMTYLDRKDLIDLFYPGSYEDLLAADIRRYN
jgi:hypothetical protein